MEGKQFFTNREIWTQVFGDDGRGGAIGDLHEKLDTNLEEMAKLSADINEIAGELKEINNINNKLTEIGGKVEEQKKKCEETINQQERENARDDGIQQAEIAMAEKVDARWRRNMKIVALIFTALGFLVTALGRFVW